MGNTDSSAYSEDNQEDPFDGIDTVGYRVLGVQPNSPASQAGLVSFLDFLVGANDKMLLGSGEGLEPGEEYDDVDLPALLQEFKDQPLELLVYNIKSQEARLVELIPSDTWGGAGLLGVTIRLDNYAGAEDRLVRVLTVEPQSPAAVAGLVPEKDFLLGTTHQTLDSTAQLAQLLHHHQDQVVELYVYNVDSDMVRVVALMPTLSWGGKGLLGAHVGTGYLHRLPSKTRHTSGTSVERKVRYIRSAPLNKPNSSSKGRRSTLPESEQLVMEPQLEMEPELEMEPSENGSSSSDDVEEVYAQKSSKLLATSTEESKQAAPAPSAQPTAPAPAEETNTTRKEQPERENAVERQQQQQQQQPQQQEVEQAAEPAAAVPGVAEREEEPPVEPQSSTESATANREKSVETPRVAQKPPAPGAAGGVFMPPPPKMHYDTPPLHK